MTKVSVVITPPANVDTYQSGVASVPNMPQLYWYIERQADGGHVLQDPTLNTKSTTTSDLPTYAMRVRNVWFKKRIKINVRNPAMTAVFMSDGPIQPTSNATLETTPVRPRWLPTRIEGNAGGNFSAMQFHGLKTGIFFPAGLPAVAGQFPHTVAVTYHILFKEAW